MVRGYPDDWNNRRRKVYKRDQYTCQNCGAMGGSQGSTELHAHHIVPKSKGGTHRKRNLVTVCKRCHDAIHGRGSAPVPVDQGSFSKRIKRAIERHYRTNEHDDGYVRLGKSTENQGTSQKKADEKRNRKYGGCPKCSESALTVSWVGFNPGSKVKIIECESCTAQFEEEVTKTDGQTRRVLNEIDDPSEVTSTGSAFFKELKDQIRLRLNI